MFLLCLTAGFVYMVCYVGFQMHLQSLHFYSFHSWCWVQCLTFGDSLATDTSIKWRPDWMVMKVRIRAWLARDRVSYENFFAHAWQTVMIPWSIEKFLIIEVFCLIDQKNCRLVYVVSICFVLCEMSPSRHLVGWMHHGRDDSRQRHVSRNWSYPFAT